VFWCCQVTVIVNVGFLLSCSWAQEVSSPCMMCADGTMNMAEPRKDMSEIVQALNFPWDNDDGSAASFNNVTTLPDDGTNNITCEMIASLVYRSYYR
jgi:hypothetical protein